MSFDLGKSGIQVGQAIVKTTDNKGFSPEYWAERLVAQIVHVSGDKDSPIRQQAEAFKENVRAACLYYIKQAIQSDRTTLIGLLTKQGELQMANILRRL